MNTKTNLDPATTSQTFPLLFSAVITGQKDTVNFLIHHGYDVNTVINEGLTPLHIAAIRGYHAIAELLILNGAEPNAKYRFWVTPLFFATLNNHIRTVRVLLKYGASVNNTDSITKVLHKAAEGDACKIIQQLLTKNNKAHAQKRLEIATIRVADILRR